MFDMHKYEQWSPRHEHIARIRSYHGQYFNATKGYHPETKKARKTAKESRRRNRKKK